jgi:hypothetical protein
VKSALRQQPKGYIKLKQRYDTCMDFPPCKGKRFGHNFVGAGPCLNGCGITQKELSGTKPKRNLKKVTRTVMPGRIHGMHSSLHDVARMISEWCHEEEQFAMYLGKVKFVGEANAWTIWAELKQSRTPIRNRAALFMSLTSKAGIEKRKR